PRPPPPYNDHGHRQSTAPHPTQSHDPERGISPKPVAPPAAYHIEPRSPDPESDADHGRPGPPRGRARGDVDARVQGAPLAHAGPAPRPAALGQLAARPPEPQGLHRVVPEPVRPDHLAVDRLALALAQVRPPRRRPAAVGLAPALRQLARRREAGPRLVPGHAQQRPPALQRRARRQGQGHLFGPAALQGRVPARVLARLDPPLQEALRPARQPQAPPLGQRHGLLGRRHPLPRRRPPPLHERLDRRLPHRHPRRRPSRPRHRRHPRRLRPRPRRDRPPPRAPPIHPPHPPAAPPPAAATTNPRVGTPRRRRHLHVRRHRPRTRPPSRPARDARSRSRRRSRGRRRARGPRPRRARPPPAGLHRRTGVRRRRRAGHAVAESQPRPGGGGIIHREPVHRADAPAAAAATPTTRQRWRWRGRRDRADADAHLERGARVADGQAGAVSVLRQHEDAEEYQGGGRAHVDACGGVGRRLRSWQGGVWGAIHR
ncbi:hypothetical protein QBC39DRAFT_424216, partial [Podospora conica]